MKIEEKDCQALLDDFKNSKSIKLSESNFDQKVISNIVRGLHFSTFVLKDNELVSEAELSEESHVMFFENQSKVLKGHIQKIENL